MKMTLLTPGNSLEIQEVRPGANLGGQRIVSIEMTLPDFEDPRVYNWLADQVYPRIVKCPE